MSFRPALLVGAGFLLAACRPPAELPEWEAANAVRPLPAPPLGLGTRLEDLPEPPDPARVRLGRWLFFDPRLSADGTVSCATCHRPEHGYSEPTPVATGVGGRLGRRKAPPIRNLAFAVYPQFFWDGRAASLEEQALGPLTSPVEMANADAEEVAARVRAVAGYAPYFAECFGDSRVTAGRIVDAIADYERTLLAGGSDWDRWQAGDQGSVSSEARRGSELFFGEAGCVACHLGDSFTDGRFHVLGHGWDEDAGAYADRGRAEVTGRPEDEGAFKTPTLRDVALRAPYLHDGSASTLREVVELYERGGGPGPNHSELLRPLELSDAERDALVAFLEALTSRPPPEAGPASFPR